MNDHPSPSAAAVANDLEAEQLRLEHELLGRAVDTYNEAITGRSDWTRTRPGVALMTAIGGSAWQASTKCEMRALDWPQLLLEQMVTIAMNVILGHPDVMLKIRVTGLAHAIGERVEQEERYVWWIKSPEGKRAIERIKRTPSARSVAARIAEALRDRSVPRVGEWNRHRRVRVGAALLQALVSTGAFSLRKDKWGREVWKHYVLEITPEAKTWINERITNDEITPASSPMLIEPRPWTLVSPAVGHGRSEVDGGENQGITEELTA